MSALALVVALGLGLGCHDDLPVPDPADQLVEGLGLAPGQASAESAALSAPPLRSGNTARLLINGEASLAERLRLITQAQRSIYVQALIWKADESGRMLADALIARKKADPSLDIRVIVDAYANIQDVHAQLLFFDLQNAGIEVEGFESFYLHWLNEVNLDDWLAGNKRFHEKYLVVDGQEAVLGGMNISDEYFRCSPDPALTWRDQDVLLSGPVVADVHAAFLDNHGWFKAIKQGKPELLNPDTYWRQWQKRHPAVDVVMDKALAARRLAVTKVVGTPTEGHCDGAPVAAATWEGVDIRFLRSRPREGERHIHDEYLARIAAARQSVFILNAYFVPVADLQAALVAAARRGVRVVVVTNSMETNDIPMITTAGRARYLELVDAGVEVYEWHAEKLPGELAEGTLHAKHATFDDQVAIIGSFNLDPRSEGLNSEDAVVIQHAGLSKELADRARDVDLAMAERITREQALAWADPLALPPPPDKVLPWADPRFDPKVFEYWLLRRVEGSL